MASRIRPHQKSAWYWARCTGGGDEEAVDPRAGDDQSVEGEEDAHEEPDREMRTFGHDGSIPHQKMTLSAMNTAPTTPAQKIGRFQSGMCCSEGIGVQP